MTGFDNAYSRIVSWARIILPLMALAILSTLFMFSGRFDTDQPIPYSDVEVDDLARDPRISQPRFSGVARNGASVSIAAQSARPDSEDSSVLLADALSARIETESALNVDMISGGGIFRDSGRRTVLNGGALATTSTGYRIESEEFLTDLDGVLLSTDTTVRATAPFGELEAGAMSLSREEDEKDSYQLVFNQGVKLIYTPQGQEE